MIACLGTPERAKPVGVQCLPMRIHSHWPQNGSQDAPRKGGILTAKGTSPVFVYHGQKYMFCFGIAGKSKRQSPKPKFVVPLTRGFQNLICWLAARRQRTRTRTELIDCMVSFREDGGG